MRAILFPALLFAASCASLPDRWELDLKESSHSGPGCTDAPALTLRLTIDDPLSRPVVVGDPQWSCEPGADSAICVRPLGVDVGTITMSARENSATLDMAGSCLYVFGPRVHGRS